MLCVNYLTGLLYIISIIIIYNNDSVLGGLISEWMLPNPWVSPECEEKYDLASKQCGEKHGHEWRQRISAEEMEKPSEQKKMFCCMKYDVSDCMEKYIKAECNADDYEVIAEIFAKKVDYLSKGNCSQYPYKSSDCTVNSMADSLQTNSNSSQTLCLNLCLLLTTMVIYLQPSHANSNVYHNHNNSKPLAILGKYISRECYDKITIRVINCDEMSDKQLLLDNNLDTSWPLVSSSSSSPSMTSSSISIETNVYKNNTFICCLLSSITRCLRDAIMTMCSTSDKLTVQNKFHHIINTVYTAGPNCTLVGHKSHRCNRINNLYNNNNNVDNYLNDDKNNETNETMIGLLVGNTSVSDRCIRRLHANVRRCGEESAIKSGFDKTSLDLDIVKVHCCVGWLRMDCVNKVVEV
ncbi:unnamed protein product [Medioppia subpectinata]|uniref:Uncharacterized protein n=1 Tax=Medioppia subpectinata TaxID=1979941 RepID=A0A7R9Q448_9ACAR|nr:unnamed protein product [Medioppia subpectinata]CAG2111074.1 unnamed protein product [Medioppia subpectinata]